MEYQERIKAGISSSKLFVMTDSKNILSYTCPSCGPNRIFKIRCVQIMMNSDPHIEYTLASCTNCDQFILLTRDEPDAHLIPPYTQQYPPHRRNPTLYNAPEEVVRSYIEAVRCEESYAWMAAVVMVRRALEAVCKTFDPQITKVYNGLRKLNEDGIISDELYKWADVLRDIGNVGAHVDENEVTKQDAEDSLDFLEAILETLYYHRPKFELMEERRSLQNLDVNEDV